jgi:uncharacterized protein (TIGR03382 family)
MGGGRALTAGETWRFVAIRYAPWLAALNLAWEVAQLPLYTLWRHGSPGEIVYSVLHCTVGDVLIGVSALLMALALTRAGSVMAWRTRRILPAATALAVAYTVFSEWLNTEVRGTWAYTDQMPTLPIVGTGVAPLLQWLLLPGLAWILSRRRL